MRRTETTIGLVMRMRGAAVAILAVALTLSSLSPADAKNRSPEEVEALIEEIAAGLRPLVRGANEPAVRWTLEDRMAVHGVPGVSIAVIENGEILFARGFGVKNVDTGEPVDEDTVFSVGSVSKMGTAAAILRMVAKGDLALDAPVNGYLSTWTVPDNAFTAEQAVTLRGILSHTAGLTVHGFPDFKPGARLPTVVETLDGKGSAKTPAVRAFYTPGTRWRYSGGGTTVAQLVIADVAGDAFETAAAEHVFAPLGMTRSTYENPLPASHGNIAHAHDEKGGLTAKPRGWHTFPEKAASGLWTTPADVARLYIALMKSYSGEEDGFLPRALAAAMMTEVGPSPFGLGPALTGMGQHRRFYHSGSNESYRAWTEAHLETGDGMIIFTNGANGARLYYEIRRSIADAMGWPYYEEILAPDLAEDDAFAQRLLGAYVLQEPLDASALRAHGGAPVSRVIVSRQRNGDLSLSAPGLAGERRLVRVAPMSFLVENMPVGTPQWIKVEFLTQQDGAVSDMIMTVSGRGMTLSKQ